MKQFEVEQKFRLKNPEKLRAMLRRLKARRLSAGLELNEFYDRRSELRKRKSILRLRLKPNKKAYLTFKGPRLSSKFSKRLELETPVDFHRMKVILKAAGFKKVFAYRKFRDEYRLGKSLIVLDHVPRIGYFFEIEGRTSDIMRLSATLGVRFQDREDKTYLEMLFGVRD